MLDEITGIIWRFTVSLPPAYKPFVTWLCKDIGIARPEILKHLLDQRLMKESPFDLKIDYCNTRIDTIRDEIAMWKKEIENVTEQKIKFYNRVTEFAKIEYNTSLLPKEERIGDYEENEMRKDHIRRLGQEFPHVLQNIRAKELDSAFMHLKYTQSAEKQMNDLLNAKPE